MATTITDRLGVSPSSPEYSNRGDYATRAAAAATQIDSALALISTGGYSTVGDGGEGTYARVTSDPGVGGFQSADGAWWDLIAEEPNVRQFGAKGDGSTDDYQAFVDCVSYATNGQCQTAFVGRGKFVINMSAGRAGITLNRVSLKGAGAVNWESSASVDYGSWLYIKGTSASPFLLFADVTFSGFSVLYPNQNTDPTSPTVYPAFISPASLGWIHNCTISENVFVNPYIAIALGASNGFNWIHNNRICALYKGITVGTSAAESRIQDNFFTYAPGYYFYNSLGFLTQLTTRVHASVNWISFEDATQIDGWSISGNAFFAAHYAIYFTGSSIGYYWGAIINNLFDGNYIGIYFAGLMRPVLTTIVGNNFTNWLSGDASSCAILVQGTDTTYFRVTITGNHFGTTQGTHVVLNTPATQTGHATIVGNTFDALPASGSSVVITAKAVGVVVSGNSFDGLAAASTNGVICSAAERLVVTDNVFKGLAVAISLFTAANIGDLIVGDNTSNSSTAHLSVSGTLGGVRREANNSWNSAFGTAAYVDTGTSGAKIPLLNAANTWSAAQSISGTGSGTPLQIVESANAGIQFTYSNQHGATSDTSDFAFNFKDSNSNNYQGAVLRVIQNSNTDTSEGVGYQFYATVAGALGVAAQLYNGLIVGAPTGSFKGTGTINATAVYDDNVLLTCMALSEEFLTTGKIDLAAWDAKVPDIVVPEERVVVPVVEPVEVSRLVRDRDGTLVAQKVLQDQPVRVLTPVYDEQGNGLDAIEEDLTQEVIVPARVEKRVHHTARLFQNMLDDGFDPRDPAAYVAKLRKDHAVPAMPTQTDWNHNTLSSGELISRMWLALDMVALQIASLHDRVTLLEAR